MALPLAAPLSEAFFVVMSDYLEDIGLDGLPDIFSKFEAAKFTQVRNIRLGFGGSEAVRAKRIEGFAAELARGTYISPDMVDLFFIRLWDIVKDVPPEACFAPLSTGFFTQKKRPHQGIWVEVHDPPSSAGTRSDTATPVVHLYFRGDTCPREPRATTAGQGCKDLGCCCCFHLSSARAR